MKAVYSLALTGSILLSSLTWSGQPYLEGVQNIVEQLVNRISVLDNSLQEANNRIRDLEDKLYNKPSTGSDILFEDGEKAFNDAMSEAFDWWATGTTFEFTDTAENYMRIRNTGVTNAKTDDVSREIVRIFRESFGQPIRYIRSYHHAIVVQADWRDDFRRLNPIVEYNIEETYNKITESEQSNSDYIYDKNDEEYYSTEENEHDGIQTYESTTTEEFREDDEGSDSSI